MGCSYDWHDPNREHRRIWMRHLITSDYLPLPAPFPDYMSCPQCGEPEVEVWCFERKARCHHCGAWLEHKPEMPCCIQRCCMGGEPDTAHRSD